MKVRVTYGMHTNERVALAIGLRIAKEKDEIFHENAEDIGCTSIGSLSPTVTLGNFVEKYSLSEFVDIYESYLSSVGDLKFATAENIKKNINRMLETYKGYTGKVSNSNPYLSKKDAEKLREELNKMFWSAFTAREFNPKHYTTKENVPVPSEFCKYLFCEYPPLKEGIFELDLHNAPYEYFNKSFLTGFELRKKNAEKAYNCFKDLIKEKKEKFKESYTKASGFRMVAELVAVKTGEDLPTSALYRHPNIIFLENLLNQLPRSTPPMYYTTNTIRKGKGAAYDVKGKNKDMWTNAGFDCTVDIIRRLLEFEE